LLAWAGPSLDAQRTRIAVSGGEVSRSPTAGDSARLAPKLPGLTPELAARVVVNGDSAQRIAMHDFNWRGRVASVELDEEESRLYWDVKIVPDSTRSVIVRYRVDAANGGILGIREFTGLGGLLIRKP
jgi:uncharacterized membrane protein YkoI